MTSPLENLLDWLPRLRGRRVVVVGDLVADEFIYGEIKRVYGDVARTSREVAFGLVLRQRAVSQVPGGAANAIHNLAVLGARPIPFGFVGSDSAGRVLRRTLRRHGVALGGVRVLRGWATPTKSRILAGSPHASAQQVLRLDREEGTPPPAAAVASLIRVARRAVRSAEALLISDYGYGAATPKILRQLLSSPAIRRRLPVVVDSRYQIRAYRGVTAATPSVPELEEAYHASIGADERDPVREITRLGRHLLGELRARCLVLTRGRHGMLLFEPGRRPQEIPPFGTDQVTDVTGAGDTVAAVFTAALAAGAGFRSAAELANVAGGLVVRKRGTATVSPREFDEALREARTGGASDRYPRTA
jgi:rfaE bifunctional protein kinase chain/domain